jgi:archaellum component FlaC
MKTLLLICSLLLATLIGAETTYSSQGITTCNTQAYEHQAQQTWQTWQPITATTQLDQFIHQYPDSTAAQWAFSLRVQGVQLSHSPPVYNQFIQRYPNTLAAQQALYTLFSLYQQQNRLSGYLAFMDRYPDSPLSLLAKQQVELLSFQLISQLDKITEYDDFIEIFPQAPQTALATQQARKKALTLEKAWLETHTGPLKKQLAQHWAWLNQQPNKTVDPNNPQLKSQWDNTIAAINQAESQIAQLEQQRLNEWLTKLDQLWSQLARLNDQQLSEPKAQVYQTQIERHIYVLRTLYPHRPELSALRDEQRYQGLINKLAQIDQTFAQQHQQLLTALRQEFGQLRSLLTRQFAEVHQEVAQIKKATEHLVAQIHQLHKDLGRISERLEHLYQTTAEVANAISKNTQYLAQLQLDIVNIQQGFLQLHHALNQGMATQQWVELKQQTAIGFATLHQSLQQNLSQAEQQQLQHVQLLYQRLSQNQAVSQALEQLASHYTQLQEEQQNALSHSLIHQRTLFQQYLGATQEALTHQSSRFLQSHQQLLKGEQATSALVKQQTELLQKTIADIEQQQRQAKKKRFIGFLKTALSVAANVVVPGSGVIVNGIFSLTQAAIEGKGWADALISTGVGLAMQYGGEVFASLNLGEHLSQAKQAINTVVDTTQGILTQGCPLCTEIVGTVAQFHDQYRPLIEIGKTIALPKLQQNYPKLTQYIQMAVIYTQHPEPGQLVVSIATQELKQRFPQMAVIADTLEKLNQGQTANSTVSELTATIDKLCPECKNIVDLNRFDEVMQLGREAVEQKITALKKACPVCGIGVSIIEQRVQGKPPQEILTNTLKQCPEPECQLILSATQDLQQGKLPTQLIQTTLAKQCPSCATAWQLGYALTQEKAPKKVLARYAKQQIIKTCPDCRGAVDLIQAIQQGENPQALVVQTLQKHLQTRCPECVEATKMAMSIGQQQFQNRQAFILKQLQQRGYSFAKKQILTRLTDKTTELTNQLTQPLEQLTRLTEQAMALKNKVAQPVEQLTRLAEQTLPNQVTQPVEQLNQLTRLAETMGLPSQLTQPVEQLTRFAENAKALPSKVTQPVEQLTRLTEQAMALPSQLTQPVEQLSRLTEQAMELPSQLTQPVEQLSRLTEQAMALPSQVVTQPLELLKQNQPQVYQLISNLASIL